MFSEKREGEIWKRFCFGEMFNRFFGKVGERFEECEDQLARE